jgi:RND superfamily putative drug exporter
MTRRLYFVGRWCSDHGWRVVALWLLALAAVVIADARLPPPPAEAFVLEGTNSAEAQRLLNRAFPGTAAPAAPLVIAGEALDAPPGRALVSDVAAAVGAVPNVNAVATPEAAPRLLSDDGSTARLEIVVDERTSGEGIGGEIQAAAEAAVAGRAEVALGGYLGASISQVNTLRSEAIGLTAAVVILLVTLRRGWPVIIPFATALLSVGIGLAAVGLLERITFVPSEATILGTMLGLGVGIDYALFLVTRHRTLLLRGFAVPDAAGRTAGTAGAGMVFAGGTLIAAVSGLALTGISFLAWLGIAAAIIVATAVLAALTLVPALLGIFGTRVLPKAWQGQERAVLDDHLDRGTWARIADAVTGRPWRYAIGSSLVLIVLALPLLAMQFGQTDGTSLPPDSPGHRATVLIAEGFGPGANGPLVTVGQLYAVAELPDDPGAGTGDPRALDPRIIGVSEDLRSAPGVADVAQPVISTDGGVAVWVVTPTTGPADPATEELVQRMRADHLPAAAEGRDMALLLGGITPSVQDLNERVAERLVPFIFGVVALSFLLLMLAYRSLVIPAKAAAMNLLSIAAAYGVVVAVFQWGWGASLIGLDGPVPIQSFVPMMMFAVLFGLSMDYEVFLLTAFSEHWQRSGDMRVAVRRGLADTGQVVTSAALIMVVIFASFILTDSDIAKMFGVGLATAVAVDASIVRCLLVPSLMVLAARWTWWLPAWLDRALPRLRVEGDPAALESIHGPAPEATHDPRRPATGAVAVCLGALGGVALAAPSPTGSAVLLAAVLAGAITGWLPRGVPGAGSSPWLRIPALLLGVGAGLLGIAVGLSLVPSVGQQPGLTAAIAVGAVAALAAWTRLRSYLIPIVLGAAVLGLAVTASWEPLGFALAPVVAAVVVPLVATPAIALSAHRVAAAFRAGASREADQSTTPAPVEVGR